MRCADHAAALEADRDRCRERAGRAERQVASVVERAAVLDAEVERLSAEIGSDPE